MLTEQITSRQVRDSQKLREPLALCPFARAGWAEDDDDSLFFSSKAVADWVQDFLVDV